MILNKQHVDYESGRSAGIYDNAYMTEDVSAGLAIRGGSSAAWQHGYIIGFFGSYELHEVLIATDLVLLMEAIMFAKKHGYDSMREGD